MKRNSTELKVKYAKGDGPKKPKNKNVDPKSELGYSRNSPFLNLPGIDIHTTGGLIDMSNTDIPLLANGIYLPKNSGTHKIPVGPDGIVREIPLAQFGKTVPGNIPVIDDAGRMVDGIWVPDWNKMRAQAKKLGAKTVKTKNGAIIYFDENWEVKNVDDNPSFKQGGWLEQYQTGSTVQQTTAQTERPAGTYVESMCGPDYVETKDENGNSVCVSPEEWQRRMQPFNASKDSQLAQARKNDPNPSGNPSISWNPAIDGPYPKIGGYNEPLESNFTSYCPECEGASDRWMRKNQKRLNTGFKFDFDNGGRGRRKVNRFFNNVGDFFGGLSKDNCRPGDLGCFKFKQGGWLDQYQTVKAQKGTVVRQDPTTGNPVVNLPEVEITGEQPDTYNNYIRNKYKDAGLLGAMFGLPLDYAFGYPQAAATKLLTGKYQLPSEALGIENPIGALVTDAILDPTNLVGAGLLTKEKALAALAASKESGLLSNAWKYNPWRFKPNPEAYYRGIGRAGVDDAMESGLIRGNPNTRFSENLYLTDDLKEAELFSKGYIAEIPKSKITNYGSTPVTRSRKNIFISENPISINDAIVYKKDWLRGYKKIDVPTRLPKQKKGGWLDQYQTGKEKKSNYDFNDLYFTDEEVKENIGEVTERRRRCVESGAGSNCLANANAYYNIYVAPKLNAPSSWQELENSGFVSVASDSKKGITENTADSWDVHGLDNRTVLFNKNDKKQSKTVAETDWKKLNLPIGAIIGYGEHGYAFIDTTTDTPLNKAKGLPIAGHSGRVVGYDKNTGEPFVFDTVNGLKRISQNTYQPITVISVDNRIGNNTYDKVSLSSGNLSFKGDLDDIELNFSKDLEYDPDEFIPFVNALTSNKGKFANAIGMSNREYNENARRAAALAIVETEGGNDFITREKWGIPIPMAYTLDQMGLTGSAGITQLNKDVLKNMLSDPTTSRKFKSVFGDNFSYSKFSFSNPNHVAFATMLLLKQNERAAQKLSERAPKEYKKSNNPDFTYNDLAWYMWNQPGTILKGEAQGDNANYKKYKAAFEMITTDQPLKSKMANKKHGGLIKAQFGREMPFGMPLPEAYGRGGLHKYQGTKGTSQTGNPIEYEVRTGTNGNMFVLMKDTRPNGKTKMITDPTFVIPGQNVRLGDLQGRSRVNALMQGELNKANSAGVRDQVARTAAASMPQGTPQKQVSRTQEVQAAKEKAQAENTVYVGGKNIVVEDRNPYGGTGYVYETPEWNPNMQTFTAGNPLAYEQFKFTTGAGAGAAVALNTVPTLLTALSMPATIGGVTYSGATLGNLIGSGFMANAIMDAPENAEIVTDPNKSVLEKVNAVTETVFPFVGMGLFKGNKWLDPLVKYPLEKNLFSVVGSSNTNPKLIAESVWEGGTRFALPRQTESVLKWGRTPETRRVIGTTSNLDDAGRTILEGKTVTPSVSSPENYRVITDETEALDWFKKSNEFDEFKFNWLEGKGLGPLDGFANPGASGATDDMLNEFKMLYGHLDPGNAYIPMGTVSPSKFSSLFPQYRLPEGSKYFKPEDFMNFRGVGAVDKGTDLNNFMRGLKHEHERIPSSVEQFLGFKNLKFKTSLNDPRNLWDPRMYLMEFRGTNYASDKIKNMKVEDFQNMDFDDALNEALKMKEKQVNAFDDIVKKEGDKPFGKDFFDINPNRKGGSIKSKKWADKYK